MIRLSSGPISFAASRKTHVTQSATEVELKAVVILRDHVAGGGSQTTYYIGNIQRPYTQDLGTVGFSSLIPTKPMLLNVSASKALVAEERIIA